MSVLKDPDVKKKLKIAGIIAGIIFLLACANFVAGALLFALHKEDPTKAQFTTIEQAYFQQAEEENPNPKTLQKIKVSIFISLLLCIGGPVALLTMSKKVQGSDMFGSTRFANKEDIQKEKLNTDRGVVIGKFQKELLRLGGYEFVLLAAPTRTGKGVGFCVPNLLQFQDSAVVLDIKGENFNLTSEFRRRYLGNQIIYFNPFAENTHRWNPLSYVSKDPNYRANDLMALATIIYPVNEKDPFWSDSAKNLFIGLGLLVLETPELPQTIGEILRQGTGKGLPLDQYLTQIIDLRMNSARPLSNACRDSLYRFVSSGETALKGIMATFAATLTPFSNAVIDKATSADDFDLRDIRKKKMTIYLNIPAGEILQASFIINLFFSQLINENVKELPEQNPDLKYQCLMLLDEFTAMGKVAIIAKGVGYMAGYNMRLAIIIQDKNQLDAVYGKEDAHNIVSNMGAVIYFTPSQINEAEEYSKMIGNNTVLSDSMQKSKGKLFGLKGEGSDSRTESFQSRALMLPQELLSMSKDLQLVVRSGIPVIKADKIRYYEDAYFKERFNAVPMHQVTIGTEKRMVPIAAKIPTGDWQNYQVTIASSDYYKLKLDQINAASNAGANAPQIQQTQLAPPVQQQAQQQTQQQSQQAQLQTEAATAINTLAIADLPQQFEAFHDFYKRLPHENSEYLPSIKVAHTYADAIINYWQKCLQLGILELDNHLVMVDLNPGHGQFCLQLMNSLLARSALLEAQLPPFLYLACCDNEAQVVELSNHPYFAGSIENNLLSVMLRAELFKNPDMALADNPIVCIAHDFLHRQDSPLFAVHYGSVLSAQSKLNPAVPATVAGAQTQITIEQDWPLSDLSALNTVSNELLDMYCAELNSAAVSIPQAAIDCIDQIKRLCGGDCLWLSADPAITDAKEIRLGCFSVATSITVPAPALPINYHALAYYFNNRGALVWQEKIPESTFALCITVMCTEAETMQPLLSDLRATLTGVHTSNTTMLKRIAESGITAAEIHTFLVQSQFDPAVFDVMNTALQKTKWSLTLVEREQWRQTLTTLWKNYLPTKTNLKSIHHYADLAEKLDHFGMLIHCCQLSLELNGNNLKDLYLLASAKANTGLNTDAIAHLSSALELQAEDAKCLKLSRELQQRAQQMNALPWFDLQNAQGQLLRLEPLLPHHAESLLEQYRDPQIAAMCRLPMLNTIAEVHSWINQQSAIFCCAVLHPYWGFIGVAGLQKANTTANFYFWLGAEHQGRGYTKEIAQLMFKLAQHNDISNIYAASFTDNQRSSRALLACGFSELEISAKSPNHDQVFFHTGYAQDQEEIQKEMQALFSALDFPYQFELEQKSLETAA